MRAMAFLLAFGLVAPIAAQDNSESTWTLTDARGGFCIWYLAEPALATEMLPKDAAPRSAESGLVGLPAQLARVIADEPRFASWIPGTICVGLYGTASVDGRQVTTAKEGEAITLITHSLAATNPRGAVGAGHHLIELGTDRGSLARAAEAIGVRTVDRSVDISKVPDSEDDEIQLKLGKTKIHWQGHPAGPSRVDSTRSMSFGYAGQRLTSWNVVVTVSPAEVQGMVGALRIDGKDDLGQALKASPIRAVGPIERGGTATVTFSRAAGR